MNFEFSLDTYSRNARLKPALLTVLPTAWTVLAWSPEQAAGWTGILSLCVTCGGTYLLAQIGRDWGKLKEPELFRRIGGRPTERMLSHVGTNNRGALLRWHRSLKQIIPDLKIPTLQQEKHTLNKPG